MNAVRETQGTHREVQFGVIALLEYITWCAILSALSAIVGIGASTFLMLMTLAVSARQGVLALVMLMGASLAADWPIQTIHSDDHLVRQVVVILAATCSCSWYRLRR